MISDDLGLTMLAGANPIPDTDTIGSDIEGAAYLATISQRSSAMTQLKVDRVAESGQKRGRLVPALVLLAAVVLIGILAVLSRSDEAPPLATEPAPNTLTENLDPEGQAMAVATGYMQAWFAGDLATARSFTTGNGIAGFFATTSSDAAPAEFAWMEAAGVVFEGGECRVGRLAPTNTWIACPFTFVTAVSQALGHDPYTGEYMLAVRFAGDEIRGQVIDKATVASGELFRIEGTRFISETWVPFEAWLRDNHPADVDSMFEGAFVKESLTLPSLTAKSIGLWRQYTEEFVAEHTSS